MKGESVKSEILCVSQIACAEKKSRKYHFSLRPPFWGKYLPNISLSYIVRKYLQSVLRTTFNWSPNFIYILSTASLNCNWFLWKFYCCWDGFQLIPKYQTKVKLRSNISVRNILVAKKWKLRCIFLNFQFPKGRPYFWFGN